MYSTCLDKIIRIFIGCRMEKDIFNPRDDRPGRYLGGPSRGFGDSGRRAIYFQGFGEKGHLFSGIWGKSITFGGFMEQGAGG